MFESDIAMTSQKMVDFVKSAYERGLEGRGAATKTLPLWTMYREGGNYLVPYVIDDVIGIRMFCIVQNHAVIKL